MKCQRSDCLNSGIVLKLESGTIQECHNLEQERLNGLAALPLTDSRRSSKSGRRDSVYSRTSTVSAQPTFGSPIGVVGEDQLSGNLDSSSSSWMDIPPLVYESRDSVSTVSEVPPVTPRLAEAVRKEMDGLQKTPAKSDIANRINLASRSPTMSIGSEESRSRDVMSAANITSESKRSVCPRRYCLSSLIAKPYQEDSVRHLQ